MAVRPDYTIGTLTLSSGSVNFTTSGSALQTAAVQAGDEIITRSGDVLIIATITGQNSGTLFQNCPASAAGAGQPLRVRFQPDGSRYQGAVRDLIEKLANGNVEALAGIDGATKTLPYFTGAGSMDAVVGAADTMPYFTGVNGMGSTGLTAFARSLLDDPNATTAYGTLGTIPNAQIPSRLQELSATLTDANTALINGWYVISGSGTNAPPIGLSFIEVMAQTSVYVRQVAYARDSSRMASRSLVNGTWTSWVEIGGGNISTNGWSKDASGLITQWGSAVVLLSSGFAGTITLPTAFPTSSFYPVLTNADWGASTQRNATLVVVSFGNSSFQFAAGGGATASANIRVSYVVKGY